MERGEDWLEGRGKKGTQTRRERRKEKKQGKGEPETATESNDRRKSGRGLLQASAGRPSRAQVPRSADGPLSVRAQSF